MQWACRMILTKIKALVLIISNRYQTNNIKNIYIKHNSFFLKRVIFSNFYYLYKTLIFSIFGFYINSSISIGSGEMVGVLIWALFDQVREAAARFFCLF